MRQILILLALLTATALKAQQVSYAEYFIDTDPGQGSGTSINVGAAVDSVNLTFSIPTTTLSQGFHRLYVRVRTSNGLWSMYRNETFYLRAPQSANPTQIVGAEYYYDNDPGTGSATAISVGAAANTVNVTGSLSSVSLTPGFHTLYVRVKDSSGNWSQAESRTFLLKVPDPSVIPKIVQAEYYFDTEPGYGGGVPVNTGAAADSVNLITQFPLAFSQPGFHRLCVRAKDAAGFWSQTESRVVFLKDPAPPPAARIVRAEYYFDTDPGYGNGVNIATGGPSDSIDLISPVSSGILTAGFHRLFVRAKDSLGRWSDEGRSFFFNMQPEPQLDHSLVRAEYFFNQDPGMGNANQVIPAFPADDSIDLQRVFPTTGLVIGFDSLYVRVRDSAGLWSFPIRQSFEIADIPSGIVEAANNTGAVLYPNPAIDVLYLVLDRNESNKATVVVRSADGREMGRRTLPVQSGKPVPILVESLSAGHYLVEVTVNEKRIVRPFVKL